MPAGPFHFYATNAAIIKQVDLSTASLFFALLSNGYTPNILASGHSSWADVSADEIAEEGGYVSGGFDLQTEGVTQNLASNGWRVTSGNAQWDALTPGIPAWRYGLLYVNTNPYWGVNKPLLAYFLGDVTGADYPVTATGEQLRIVCPVDGWFRTVCV